MAKFLVSFDLEYNSTYQSRYESFTKEIKKGAKYWDDTTSFYVVDVNDTIDAFCHRLYVNTDFNATMDLMLVVDAEKVSGRIRGKIKNQNIFQLLPFVKKL